MLLTDKRRNKLCNMLLPVNMAYLQAVLTAPQEIQGHSSPSDSGLAQTDCHFKNNWTSQSNDDNVQF